MQAKKRTNAPSSQGSRSNKDREERLSLLGYDKASPSRITTATMTMSPPSSGNSATLSFRKERRRVAKSDEAEEERVSLMGTKKMKPRIENSNNNNIKPSGPSRLVRRFGKGNKNSPPWTVSRTMKYIALMVISACTTFLLLRKEPKAVQWEEYQNMLDPDEGKETRCFVSLRNYSIVVVKFMFLIHQFLDFCRGDIYYSKRHFGFHYLPLIVFLSSSRSSRLTRHFCFSCTLIAGTIFHHQG